MPQDSYGGQSFAPIDFDGSVAPPPDLAEAKFRFKITAIEVRGTKPKPQDPTVYPMLVITSKATKVLGVYPAGDPGAMKLAKASVGGQVTDYLALFPEALAQRGKMGKQKFRDYCSLLGLPFTVVPKKIETEADFADFIKGALNKGFDGYILHREDDNGEPRPEIHVKEPRKLVNRTAGAPRLDDEGEEEEPTGEEPEEEEEDAEPEAEPEGGVDDEEEEEEEEEEPEPPPPPPKAAKKTKATKAAK